MSAPVLQVSALCAGYGKQNILKELSFSLNEGEILCIVGESGSGKTTLLKALLSAADVTIRSGQIYLCDTELTALSAKERSALCPEKIGMILQDPGSAFNPIRSYRKQFIETLKSHGKYDASGFEREAAEALAKVGLSDAKRILHSCPYALSCGMNQRAALALALLLRQGILFGDEPTSALDATIQLQVSKELKKLRDENGIAQIIVTHNLALARFLADRTGVMQDGKLVELGETEELLKHPQHPYTESLIRAVPRLPTKASARSQAAGVPVPD
ncbi:MAG: ABC transporter ATP-binding protein [Lachnospiraceae bacterium]|nr:ABC transporter ATP-binding protein [Lachnospiraceae bacterium]